MVERDYFGMISDEEKAQYKFGFCENCLFYECELVEEYTQFRENHTQIHKLQVPTVECADADSFDYTKNTVLQAISVSVSGKEQDNSIFLTDSSPDDTDSSDAEIISYDQSKLENRCVIKRNFVCQVECGRKNVTDGIGDHYKIEITEKLKKDGLGWKKTIKEGTTDRWEPLQPVFISAQTGQGKNYFIENTLIPYVRDLNYREKTDYKILIFSNRLALKQQIKNRIDGNTDLDNEENSEEGKIYPYKEVVEVMTYQSLMRKEGYLEKVHSKYVYVICDEAHFFTSDAMFNPHTQKILETIVRLFQNAVRVYMSATPYECLEHIIKCEEEEQTRLNYKQHGEEQRKWKIGTMIFYHFKRDYSYLDIKTYSLINELYDEIVESVVRRKEKWLIFIDDKEKCVKEKDKLEKLIEDKKSSLVIEDKKSKKKDVKDAETDKDNKAEKKVERVFAVDADSKKEPVYQEIVKNERLNKDTYVLISTSVLDNGVNLTGIKNIVVSDMEKTKCLQMVGRARRKNDDESKTLYMKRFCANEVDQRIKNLMRQQDAYHSYELAYDENGNACSPGVYQFLNKYYNGKVEDWEDAKHWFGRPFINATTELYLNEIAKSLVEKLIPQYQYIFDEMEEEKNEQQNQESEKCMGQKYLEYQLSWFGKKYCVDDDITFVDKEKSKKEFLAFLEAYAESGEKIEDTGKDSPFRKEFTKLSDFTFGRKDPNKKRIYSITKINSILEEENINYKVVSESSYWLVMKYNWEIEDAE
ncbi:MAG: DEAD/DEAH box helicase family protein [Lachnospiraceae bacterium]|nr:DEAD/DEAH box helicase family protein [Lachnospiraceae bacterium]